MTDKKGNTRIAILCNNKMAMPALQRMAGTGVLCSIATADKDPEVVHVFGEKAAELRVPYYTISGKNHTDQLHEWLDAVQPDMVFVITFPWRIAASLLAIPKMGFWNFHFGLLPEMRGADPIFESIRQRKQVAGATVHAMDEGLDTGPILIREEIPLPPEYTYGMLSSQMAMLGDKMCAQMIGELQQGKDLNPVPQDETNAQYWPKINGAAMQIQWQDATAAEIIAQVRACNPIARGGVPTIINNWMIGVCDVNEVNLQGDASAIAPGTVLAIDYQNGLVVCCKEGKAIKLEVVYAAEGMFPGYKLAFFGIAPGMAFGQIAHPNITDRAKATNVLTIN